MSKPQSGLGCLETSALLLASLELSDAQIYESKIRARLGTAVHFCEEVVLALRTVAIGQTTSKRRESTFLKIEDFDLRVKARIRPWLSCMCHAGVHRSRCRCAYTTTLYEYTLSSPLYAIEHKRQAGTLNIIICAMSASRVVRGSDSYTRLLRCV